MNIEMILEPILTNFPGIETYITSTLIIIAAGVISLLVCLFGLKLVRAWSAVVSFAGGAVLGYVGATLAGLEFMVSLGVAGGAGLVLMILAICFKAFGSVILCMVISGVTAAVLMQPEDLLFGGICVAIGIAVGLISIKLAKSMVSIMTALQGGVFGALVVDQFVELPQWYLIYIIGAVITIIGIVVQFFQISRSMNKNDMERAEEIRAEISVENEVEAMKSILDDLD